MPTLSTLSQPNTSTVINHVAVNGKRTYILSQLQNNTLALDEIEDRFEIERRDLHRLLAGWEKWGGITKVDDSKRTLSLPGGIVSRAYFAALDEIGRKPIKILSVSDERWAVLRKIGQEPISKRELVRTEALPTRQTINKAIEKGVEKGWITEYHHPDMAEVTPAGKQVFDTYDKLEQVTAQAIDKTECLRDLNTDPGEIPAEKLFDAEMVVSTPDEPYAPIQRVRGTTKTECQHMRAISSIHDPVTTRAFAAVQERGTQMDVITPTSALDELPHTSDELGLIIQFSLADNYNWVGYPGSPSMGMAIYDREKVVFGPRDQEQATDPSAVIESTDDDIIEWCISVFDIHMLETEPIPIEKFVQALDDAGIDFNSLLPNPLDGEEKNKIQGS